MSNESLTQKWLRQNVGLYQQKDRVFSDIDTVLNQFTTIRPKSDVYTYDDGRTQLLLCIHGLLPITFRGTLYNIPIAIWLTRDYPREPPIAYVVPTNDMLVKAGKFMEVSGRCTIEYLLHWEKKKEGSNLLTLLEAMQDLFSREPPVYSRPKNVSARHLEGKPPPLLPQHPVSPNHIERPRIPPKPSSASPSRSSTPRPPPRLPHIHTPPRPPPPSHPISELGPPHYGIASPGYHYSPTTVAQTSTQWAIGPNIHQPVQSSPPTVSHQYSTPPVQPPHISLVQHAPPPPNLLDEDAPEPGPSSQPAEHAPLRPPNPELLHLHAQVHAKLNSELASISQALTLDSERLRAHQADLLAGEPAIRDEMSRLEAVRDVCQNVASRLGASVGQAERNIAELRRKGDPEVDELVCSTSIVHNQLINLVAEDNAIEDTIYHLHRALNTGRMDLERFLRTTRVLAEEQFMKRALIEKIQAGVTVASSMGINWG